MLHHPREKPKRLLLFAMLLAIPHAFSRAQARGSIELARHTESSAAPMRDISGTWQGVFRLDSAWQLPQRVSARNVAARLSFGSVGDATPTTSSPRSVHAGTFDIDFSKFGFTVATREALGWSVGTDSMYAMLNPTVGHGQVEIRGALRGDAVAGTWRYTSDPGGAHGTFELRKIAR